MSSNIILGTKAETLLRAKKILGDNLFLSLIYFTVKEWRNNKSYIIKKIKKKFKNDKKLIVRSSCLNEDSKIFSNAGSYESILNVKINSLETAINKVISSYDKNPMNQIIVQPMMENVAISGVVMTRDIEDGTPYITLNYDDYSGSTNSVTSGSIIPKKLSVHHSFKNKMIVSERFKRLLKIIENISNKLDYLPLDIEFGIDQRKKVKIFQIRQINNINYSTKEDKEINKNIIKVSRKFQKLVSNKNYFKNKTIFTNMTDWNPVEMIGENPSNLSYSIYENLITKNIWSKSRNYLGYKNCKSKLMHEFLGKPYINTKCSFFSFLPNKLNKKISKKIVKNNLQTLKNHPEFHDKVEFNIVDNCNYINLYKKYNTLYKTFLTKKEFETFYSQVTNLTNNLLNTSKNNYLNKSIIEINKLKKKQDHYKDASIKKIIYDCKKYGTFHFSIIARLAFIAEIIFRSLIESNTFKESRLIKFKNSINTITNEFITDYGNVIKKKITKKKFFTKYGHLRPSTYDINAKKYSDIEFRFIKNDFINQKKNIFRLKNIEIKKIKTQFKKNNINISPEDFFSFSKKAIVYREYAKFIFSKNISLFLDKISLLAKKFKISSKEIGLLNIDDFLKLNKKQLIDKLKKIKTKKIKLNPQKIKLNFILNSFNDFYVIPTFRITPNFTGKKKISKKIIFLKGTNQNISLKDKIICIENADPGYDWIFTKKIAGLITINGGANSHMFIRCNEFNIPSAIGCGKILFEKIISRNTITINPIKKRIEFHNE